MAQYRNTPEVDRARELREVRKQTLLEAAELADTYMDNWESSPCGWLAKNLRMMANE